MTEPSHPRDQRCDRSGRRPRQRLVPSLFRALIAAILLDPSEVHAASLDGSGGGASLGGWFPGVGILLALDSQEGDARASSAVRGDLEGDGLILTPLVGVEAEILSPPLTHSSALGRPRLLVRGGVSRSFDVERTLAKEGSPGTIDIPVIDNNQDGIPDQRTPLAAVGGRGTRFQTEVQPWGFNAAVGLAFEVPPFGDSDRHLRIKPSLEYRRERMQTTVFLGEAQSIDGSALCPCRSINSEIATKQTFHAIGPGLELEMDASRVSSTVVTLYGAIRAYRVLDGRSIDSQGEGRFDDGTPTSLEGRLERDPWSFRFGVGLRLRWGSS